MIKLSKKNLRDALELDSDAALARWFEISQSAVSQWPEEGNIPERRAMEAALKRPDLFGSGAVAAPSDTAPVSDRAA